MSFLLFLPETVFTLCMLMLCGIVGEVCHPIPYAPSCPDTLLWPQEFFNANIYHKSRAAARAAFLFLTSLALNSECCNCNFDDYSEVYSK